MFDSPGNRTGEGAGSNPVRMPTVRWSHNEVLWRHVLTWVCSSTAEYTVLTRRDESANLSRPTEKPRSRG